MILVDLFFIICSSFFFGQIIKKLEYKEPDKWEKFGLIFHPLIVLMASTSTVISFYTGVK